MNLSSRFLSDERLFQDILHLAIEQGKTNIVRQLILRGVPIEKQHILTFLAGDESQLEILDLLAPKYYGIDDVDLDDCDLLSEEDEEEDEEEDDIKFLDGCSEDEEDEDEDEEEGEEDEEESDRKEGPPTALFVEIE